MVFTGKPQEQKPYWCLLNWVTIGSTARNLHFDNHIWWPEVEWVQLTSGQSLWPFQHWPSPSGGTARQIGPQKILSISLVVDSLSRDLQELEILWVCLHLDELWLLFLDILLDLPCYLDLGYRTTPGSSTTIPFSSRSLISFNQEYIWPKLYSFLQPINLLLPWICLRLASDWRVKLIGFLWRNMWRNTNSPALSLLVNPPKSVGGGVISARAVPIWTGANWYASYKCMT